MTYKPEYYRYKSSGFYYSTSHKYYVESKYWIVYWIKLLVEIIKRTGKMLGVKILDETGL